MEVEVTTPLKYPSPENNPLYRGEPLSPDLAQGVHDRRTCADLVCLLLFLAFQVGLFVIAIYGFVHGSPTLLVEPFNSYGYQCGVSPLKQYPYLYSPSPQTPFYVCANGCPRAGETDPPICRGNSTPAVSCDALGTLYNSTLFVRTCVPSRSGAALISDSIPLFQRFTSDLIGSWPLILVTAGWSLILSVVLLCFLRKCGGCIIWASIALYFLSLVGFGVASFVIGLYQPDPVLYQVVAYICWSVAALSLLLLLCTFKRIRTAAAIIKTAADYAEQRLDSFLVPLLGFFLQLSFAAFWVAAAIFTFGTGTPSPPCSDPFSCVDWNNNLRNSLAYLFIGLFWNLEFLCCFTQFVIASSVAYWYYGHLPGNQTRSPFCKSVCRAVYHAGSIAFAALVLVAFFLVRVVMDIFRSLFKEHAQKEDKERGDCCRLCCDCARCCIHCFERFLRFLDHTAIVMMAVSGGGFCESAHQSFYLAMRSKEVFALTMGSAHFVLFFGRLLITAVSTFCSYLLLTQVPFFAQQVYQPFFPTLLFAVVGYVVAAAFLDVFGIGSQTILFLFCLEHDLGQDLKACPPELQAYFAGFRLAGQK